jgi:hypothetical protein
MAVYELRHHEGSFLAHIFIYKHTTHYKTKNE